MTGEPTTSTCAGRAAQFGVVVGVDQAGGQAGRWCTDAGVTVTDHGALVGP